MNVTWKLRETVGPYTQGNEMRVFLASARVYSEPCSVRRALCSNLHDGVDMSYSLNTLKRVI